MKASAKFMLFVKAIGAVACLGVLGFFLITKSTDIIGSDGEVAGSSGTTATGMIGLNNKDKTKNILGYIEQNDIPKALSLIDEIQNDNKIPDAVKEYFSKFKNCCYTKDFDTEYFIKKAAGLETFWKDVSPTKNTRLLSIIPYYCIKVQDQNDLNQKEKRELYMDYYRAFQNEQKLNANSANIICLYAYSCYEYAYSMDKKDSYKNAIENITKLIADYEEDLSNPTYITQASYINEAIACLEFKADQGFLARWKDKIGKDSADKKKKKNAAKEEKTKEKMLVDAYIKASTVRFWGPVAAVEKVLEKVQSNEGRLEPYKI